MSMMLKTSPVKTNKPFRKRRPAQNKRYCVKGANPKVSIRKANAEARSIPPRIFTKTMVLVNCWLNKCY